MGGLVYGAMQGAGEAGVKAGLEAQQQFGQQDLLKMKTDADKELQASMQSFHRGENELNRAHAENLQGRAFEHAEDMQWNAQDFTKGENKLARELQERMHKETIGVQRAGLGIQMAQLKLAQDHITLVPQADGSMQKMGPDGTNKGTFTDQSGNVVYGTKDVAASTKILMEGNIKQMTALESEIKTSMDPEEKKALRGRMDFLQRSNEILASGGKMDSTPSQAGAKWDSGTGKVVVDGKEVGTAKTEAEARELVAKARKVGPEAPAATATPGARTKTGALANAVGNSLPLIGKAFNKNIPPEEPEYFR